MDSILLSINKLKNQFSGPIMNKIFYTMFCVLLFFYITGCSDSSKPSVKTKDNSLDKQITVFVTIPPQKSIVHAIAEKYVHIKIMVPPGREPHDYQPTPRQMLNLYKAKAYFEIGLPFEKTLVNKFKKMNIKTKFINMRKNTKALINYVHGKTTIDPHIWLSPIQLKILCQNTLIALIKLLPQHKNYFKHNSDVYIKKINKVYSELKVTLKPFKGKTIFVFHPAFGYFTSDFGLKQEAVEIEGKTPTPKELFNLILKAKKTDTKVIFVEPQFSKKSAYALAQAINGSVISINPLSENILDNFSNIAQKIKQSFLERNTKNFKPLMNTNEH